MSHSQLQEKSKKHYEDFPFDFLSKEDEENIEQLQPLPFKDFVESYVKVDDHVIDVGCGPGRASLFLYKKGIDLTSFDLSLGSIRLSRRRAPHQAYVCGTNLNLPIRNERFDVVVSDGVIHHTPDARKSFSENARILKDKGYMFCAVYQRNRYYYYVYTYIGKPIRWLEKSALGRAVIYSTLLPVYYFVHLLKSRGKRTWLGAKNFFYDYIITPQATFHTYDEVVKWGKEESLEILDYDNKRSGNVHSFVFQKSMKH